MKINPFALNALPVQLSDTARAQILNYSTNEILAMILANVGSDDLGRTIPLVLTLDTAAYATGDVLADTQEIPGAIRNVGGAATLRSLTLIDLDDNTAAQIDLVFFTRNVTLGTENVAPAISDADCTAILGIVSVPAANFIDLGGAKIATVLAINLQVTADAGTSIYVGAITRGSPTQTAAGIQIQFGFKLD